MRVNESGAIISPRKQDLPVMALGSSISTNGTLEADVIVVRSFEELEQRSSEVGHLIL